MNKSIIRAEKVTAPRIKMLVLAMAAQALVTGYCHAGPTGGVITGGEGTIENNNVTTTVNQNSDRLSINWNSFNVAPDERVEFVQPDVQSVALNRILDNNGSSILGRIDANGHVILMNPNGILFGEDATINVGGLVASGLNINTDDFINGDLAFAALEGSAGTVVNRGIIEAAVGGNVALLGKSVANHGLIRATLGHVALASGSEAVVTFDEQGLIGLRIDKEALASEIGEAAVNNNGLLHARGGKILMNASVSADLFSQVVNRGKMGDGGGAVVHDDGSFTLGAGNTVVNSGTVEVSTNLVGPEYIAADELTIDAGHVMLAGKVIEQRGQIYARGESDGWGEAETRPGEVYIEATDTILFGEWSRVSAIFSGLYHFLSYDRSLAGGTVSLQANGVLAEANSYLSSAGDMIISAQDGVALPGLSAHNLFLQTTGDVTQTNDAEVRAHSHFLVANGANIDLSHEYNWLGSVSLDARYNSTININTRASFGLHDIHLVGSTLRMQADYHVRQASDTQVQLYGSELYLDAGRLVELGANNLSDIIVNHSLLDITFGDSIRTNNAITLVDDHPLLPARAQITGPFGSGGSVRLSSSEAIDLDVITEYSSVTIRRMLGKDASLEGWIEVDQTGPINLSGTLHWESMDVTLDHSENDINLLQGFGFLGNSLIYVDKNDLTLGDLGASAGDRINVTSLGEGSTIRQARYSSLNGAAIQLKADNIDLGAGGRSEVHARDLLQLDFSESLTVNGTYRLNSDVETLLDINGDAGDNYVKFGEYASTNPFTSSAAIHNIDIDLGEGENYFLLENDLSITGSLVDVGIRMGSGDDALTFMGDVTVDGQRARIEMDMDEGDDELMFIGDFVVDADSSMIDLNMGAGDDAALLLGGLRVVNPLEEGSQVNMGSGDDWLIFSDHVDVPIRLEHGRDVVISVGSDTDFDLVDYDTSKDTLLITEQ